MGLRRLQVNTKMNGWIEIVNSLGIDVLQSSFEGVLQNSSSRPLDVMTHQKFVSMKARFL
jgi:hypothetical protein